MAVGRLLVSVSVVLRSGIMPQGTIKKVIADKGFGFIEGDRGDLFFHHSEVEGATIETLQIGQQVDYEEGRGPKGPRAEKVRPA
jgi:CspA family cold shock protein